MFPIYFLLKLMFVLPHGHANMVSNLASHNGYGTDSWAVHFSGTMYSARVDMLLPGFRWVVHYPSGWYESIEIRRDTKIIDGKPMMFLSCSVTANNVEFATASCKVPYLESYYVTELTVKELPMKANGAVLKINALMETAFDEETVFANRSLVVKECPPCANAKHLVSDRPCGYACYATFTCALGFRYENWWAGCKPNGEWTETCRYCFPNPVSIARKKPSTTKALLTTKGFNSSEFGASNVTISMNTVEDEGGKTTTTPSPDSDDENPLGVEALQLKESAGVRQNSATNLISSSINNIPILLPTFYNILTILL